MGRCLLIGLLIAVSSFTVPLMLIGLSASLSRWFNIYDNALSDLGHAVRSDVAPLFNLGLSLGGLLLVVFAVRYVRVFSHLLEVLLMVVGYSLILVAVFDEVYGKLHFAVSVLFFISVLAMMLTYTLVLGNAGVAALATLLISLNIITWSAYFIMRVPRGAAIPELISISSAIPFYIHLARNAITRSCRS